MPTPGLSYSYSGSSLTDSASVAALLPRVPMRSRSAHDDAHGDSDISPAWEPDHSIELELRGWQSQGYHPATIFVQHAYLQHRLSYSDIELQAIQLMDEPMEFELPAMLAYIPFPETWFTEVGLYHEHVKELEPSLWP